MKIKGLHARLTIVFILAATSILLISSLIVMLEVHHHFKMFQIDAPEFRAMTPLTIHFERAVIGSIFWTSLGVFVLVCVLSYIVANRLSRPLIQMRMAAEKMAKGDLDVRVNTQGNDELNELGQSLNELAALLKNQEAVRKNMTSDIAHELRTPLATLKSHLEAIEDGIFEATPDRMHSFREEIERLILLVQDLEQLTTFEAPDFILEKKQEELDLVILQSISTLKQSFDQKGVDVKYSDSVRINLWLDKKRMVQLFINLLTNALKFTPSGGNVIITSQKEPDTVIITIKDTGIGIPEEDVKKVFERFYRSEKSRNRQFGGSGIGLTIAKQLVEAHGGTIWITSVLGEGTTVYIRLPLNK